GGGASDGGTVTVTNTGDIFTRGADSYGIFAQSVGGGGGVGGDASHGIPGVPTWLEPFLELTPLKSLEDMQIVVGGSGGSSGNGDAVNISNEGNIVTLGNGSSAIFAQSIGGGGGVAGAGAVGLVGKVGIGGEGGAAGDGGDVTVSHEGQIETFGDAAYGISAQSVGGGGGAAGDVGRGIFDFGLNVAFGQPGGGGGDGGAVDVLSEGDITTHGTGAIGIFAQSVGGGGGIAGDVGTGIGFAGSVGGDGSGGAVNVTHTGNITTFGDASHGIFAQSAGGKDFGGTVNVTLNSNIIAYGENSTGIIAQSRGDMGAGDISVNLSDGALVRGGSGAGAGVNIDGGFNNTLNNAGSISALSGTSIIGGVGNETVNNNGVVTGSVNLGAGANAFNNNPGATFNAGALVNLGAGNTLTNAGILAPGGSGAVVDMILDGDYVQAAAGLMEIEIGGFTPGTFDFIDITGTANLAGGNINFSFMPGYDIAADIAPGQSMTLQFLNADNIESFACSVSYDFLGTPLMFNYNVFQADNGLYFEATNAIPAPGAFLLVCIGLGCIRGALRRTRQSAQS
ncbi:MAG TPA: hypothetical protein VMX36_03380, partial [Sedimentisphaerales bacterium]|nr:hypothetical protein [Sedimentisphaerales bacterium]